MVCRGVARSLCDLGEHMDSGHVEECASREQHGYAGDGKLDHIHYLREDKNQ